DLRATAPGFVWRSMNQIPAGSRDLVVSLHALGRRSEAVSEPPPAPPPPEPRPKGGHNARGASHGVVVDPHDRPVPDALLSCPLPRWSPEPPLWRTDSRGEFEVRDLSLGKYPFTVRAEGYSRATIEVAVEEQKTTEVRIEVGVEGRIAGRVLT